MNRLAKTFSLTACALAVSALISACGGGGDGVVVPPTVSISATPGDANTVTFAFEFSSDVSGSFDASDVALVGGTAIDAVKQDPVNATRYTLVVKPDTGVTTVQATVAAEKFVDFANVANNVEATWIYDVSSGAGSATTSTTSTSTTSTSTSSTNSVPSTTSLMTFDESTTKITAFNGDSTTPANTSSVIVDTGTNQVLKFVRSAQAQTWAGATISTLVNSAIPTVHLTDTQRNVTLKVKAPAAGVVVRLKLEDASTLNSADNSNPRTIEAEATTQTNAWETLTFNFATPVAVGTAGFSASYTYSKATVFPYFGKTGAEVGGEKIVYIDDLAFDSSAVSATTTTSSSTSSTSGSTSSTSSTSSSVGTTTTTTLPPGTLSTFGDAPVVVGFNGDASTIELEATGSTNKVLQIAQTTTAADINIGKIAGTNVTLSQPIPLSMSSRSITLRVKAATAGTYPIMLRLAKAADDTSGADPKVIQTAVVSKALTTGWQNVTFDFDRYFDSTTYDKLTVFFNYNVAGTNTFYVDDIKLATTASGLASFDEATLPALYRLSSFGAGITQTSQASDPLNSANKVAKVDLAATANNWAGTVFYNIDNDTTVSSLLTTTSQTVKLYVYSPKSAVKVRLKLEDASTFVSSSGTNVRSIEADATTTKVNSWENLTFNFTGVTGYNALFKYNKATVSFNYGTPAPAPATFYFESLTPAP